MNRRGSRLLRASGAVLAMLGAAHAASAQDTPPPKPPSPAPAPAPAPAEPSKQIPGFRPDKSVYSRLSDAKIPTGVVEPSGPELAAKLGLEVVDPNPSDGVVRYRHVRTGSLFVFVPGGTFKYGSNYSDIYSNRQVAEAASRAKNGPEYFDWEQPQTEIYVSPFFIGQCEVTNGEYRQFLADWKAGKVTADLEYPLGPETIDHTPYLSNRGDVPFWGEHQPVVGLSWLDAWAYCRWVGGRMPTEAEWEKAARGSDGRLWPWGNEFDPMRANTAESGNRRTLDVGTYPGGRSVYGALDMSGNAQEYCVDSFEPTAYRYLRKKDPCLLERFPPSPKRAVRGGNWNYISLLHRSRVTARGMAMIQTHYSEGSVASTDYLVTGIRVVLSTTVDLYPPGALAPLLAERAKSIERNKQLKESHPGGAPPDKSDAADPANDGSDGGGVPAKKDG
jgi:formylglycine-generating enzyme required for sulfatase activity